MPLTLAEWLPFAIGSALLWTTDIGALVAAWSNRQFAPLKAKNLPLITVTLAASFMYWVGLSLHIGFGHIDAILEIVRLRCLGGREGGGGTRGELR
ncbi:hypothetical protein SYNPS1DRAFT_24711 [Syncephalis pseudoplumigaleata]|uniref:Uncharacterized protein n=1 Tax=Syncephalis pseudoplumigaleata TaxID=1712513 RepID=A0A4P9YV36_9FUNG|nr:hypothetical protein SYNPS1DRAFT_24711 [Syncephalis pseudoplumigaleata]|eukprot:RKP23272.1 hypothetical protein SYNPS1DRAFT_24711 [Syncephalis pseudoplumigaleata]